MASPIAHADPRPIRLAAELRRLGLSAEAALHIAGRLTQSHPLARRVGVRGIARWLRQAGLADDLAANEAAVLFALDALDLGHSFGTVIDELGLAGIPSARAQGAAIEASRIHRSAPLQLPDDLLPVPMVLGALATTVALGIVFLHLLLSA